MNQPDKKDLSVVKTSDLIYVFCAAAWVNVLTGTFNDGANWQCYTLAFLTFALIPLELYTGSLWQQAVALVDDNPNDDAVQQSVIAALDIFRLFALTMAFILLYIPLKAFKQTPDNFQGQESAEAYIIFIAMFLSANWVWNQILFKGKFCRNFDKKPDYYQAILDKYTSIMRASQQASSAPNHDLVVQTFKFAGDFTIYFGQFNRFLFEKMFLWIFSLLYAFGVLGLIFDTVHGNILAYIGWLSIGIFSLQIIAKLIQIVFFSNVVSDIRIARSTVPASAKRAVVGESI